LSGALIENKDGGSYERVELKSEGGEYKGFIIIETAPRSFAPEMQVTIAPMGLGFGRESHFIIHFPKYAKHLVSVLRKCADMIEARMNYLEKRSTTLR